MRAFPICKLGYDEVFQFVRRRTTNEGDAEEITQSVFAQAAAQLGAANAEFPPPLAWLYTVAQRRLIDEARRRTSRRPPQPLREDTEARGRLLWIDPALARALRPFAG